MTGWFKHSGNSNRKKNTDVGSRREVIGPGSPRVPLVFGCHNFSAILSQVIAHFNKRRRRKEKKEKDHKI